MNGELLVRRGENLAQVKLVELCTEVIIAHPPVAVVAEGVIELVLEAFVVVPCLVFVCKLASPLAMTPRVANSDELQAVYFPDLLDAVSVVEKDTCIAHALFEVAVFVFDCVGATKQEALLVELFQVLPELATFDGLDCLRRSEVELLAHTSCEVNESLVHVSAVQHLVIAMKLGIGFLHEWDPELLGVQAVPVQRRLALCVVGNPSVHDYVLPSAVLEELEDCKAMLDAVIHHQVFEQLWVSA